MIWVSDVLPKCYSEIREKHQQALGSLQSSLDSEASSRIEATKMRKKIEGDFKDMEIQLCAANRQVSQTTRALGQLQSQMKVLSNNTEEQRHAETK